MRGKSKATLRRENLIVEIVEERHPISVRGVCYALFTMGELDDMSTKETQKISRVMTAMRENGELDWRKIADATRTTQRPSAWSNPSEIIESAVAGYRRDAWQDQPVLVEVWSEKSTIAGVIDPVLQEYQVTFRVMRGFGSFTSVRQAAEDSLHIGHGQRGLVLYIGDHDPSGRYMSDIDLPTRLGRYGSEWDFKRVAVIEDDFQDLPSFSVDTKTKDSNRDWFIRRHGRKCYELDAMNPNDLRNRLSEQIETSLDLLKWESSRQIEEVEIASMREFQRSFQATLHGRP